MENRKIIIYGCGNAGKNAFFRLKNNYDIVGFMQTSIEKEKKFFLNQKVYSVDQINKISFDNIFIASIYWKDILNELETRGYLNIVRGIFINELFEVDVKNKTIDQIDDELVIIMNKNERKKADINNIVIKGLDLVITEKCTLKCENCMNLIQFFTKPREYKCRRIIDSVIRLSKIVRKIECIQILGGEPFLNKDIGKICDELSKINNIEKIRIFTNSTLLPSEDILELIKISNAEIYISDYGNLSRRKNELIQACEKHHIPYLDVKNLKWINSGGIDKFNYNQEQVKHMYEYCRSRIFCNSLNDGKLFICAKSANGNALHAIKAEEDEYIDLLNNTINNNVIKQKLYDLLYVKTKVNACYYCNRYGSKVEPAIQVMRDNN